MPNQGIWIIDPTTKEDRFIYYSELEEEVIQSFIKPVGGFIFPANLFTRASLPDVPFYVKDWLPKRGKSMLYAPPKSGKSFLSLQLSRCVASGNPFLGIPTARGTVLYIQFELGEEILQARLKNTGKDYDNVFVGTTFSLKLDTKGGQAQLWRAMEAVEPAVLILDPWYKAIVGEENDSTDVRGILDFLDSVIEAFNCSLFIIHHAGKDLSKRGRGTSVLEDWVDSYLQMQRTSKAGEALKVKIRPIFLRHAQLPPEPILAELGEDFEFHVTGQVLTVKQQVFSFIVKVKEYVTPATIFEQGIGSNTSVYKALKELVNEDKVVRSQWGHYCKS